MEHNNDSNNLRTILRYQFFRVKRVPDYTYVVLTILYGLAEFLDP